VVVDGDTLRVGGERVRLFGVDAPELSQMCGAEAPKVACGQLAARWLRSRVQGRVLRCTRVDTDRYGRLVARCSVEGSDVGRSIAEAGWATAYRKYSLDYVGAEQLARAARRGGASGHSASNLPTHTDGLGGRPWHPSRLPIPDAP
jgi:endonuclease YncB( thermonuclease family)